MTLSKEQDAIRRALELKGRASPAHACTEVLRLDSIALVMLEGAAARSLLSKFDERRLTADEVAAWRALQRRAISKRKRG